MSRRDTHAAATRVVAAYEGWPDAADDISAEDAVDAARGYLCLSARKPAELTPWRVVSAAIIAGLALAVVLFALLMIFTGGKP